MALEAALAAGVVLALFSARRVLGLAPVYTTVGYRGKNAGRDRVAAA